MPTSGKDIIDLTDPKTWSAIIALLALVLSQFPPIKQVFKRRKINVFLPPMISLWHFLGNINLNVQITIYNAGGKKVNIRRIEFIIKDKESSFTTALDALTYSQHQSQRNIFIGHLHLDQGGQWDENIRCLKLWDRQEERESSEIISKIRMDLFEKSITMGNSAGEGLLEADNILVEKAKDFFQRKFNLREGNYYLFVVIHDNDEGAICIRGFEFTLFENHINSLKSVVNHYKYGAGITFTNENPDFVVPLMIYPIDDDKAVDLYRALST